MTGYWSVVEPYWDACTTDDANAFLSYYASMPEVARNLLTTHWVVSEVCNGGFHQLVTNATGVLLPEAIVGFRAIQLDEIAEIASEACSFFGQTYPREQVSRIEALERFAALSEPDSWNPFEEADDRFYAALALKEDRDAYTSSADSYAENSLS
jgi:hypothetical protein